MVRMVRGHLYLCIYSYHKRISMHGLISTISLLVEKTCVRVVSLGDRVPPAHKWGLIVES
jgi:hypothetical protein